MMFGSPNMPDATSSGRADYGRLLDSVLSFAKNLTAPAVVLDRELRLQSFSPAFAALAAEAAEEAVEGAPLDMMPRISKALGAMVRGVLAGAASGGQEEAVVRYPDGTPDRWRISVHPLRQGDGSASHVMVLFEAGEAVVATWPPGVVDAVAASAPAPREAGHVDRTTAPNLSQELIEKSPCAYIIADDDRVLYVNPAAVRLFGAASSGDLVGRDIYELVPAELRARGRRRIARTIEEGHAVGVSEDTFLRLDGTLAYVEVGAAPVMVDGRAALQLVAVDTTARKRTEERLRALVAEKETLLREVHHRVKNNLQIVSSLLNLQLRQITNPLLCPKS